MSGGGGGVIILKAVADTLRTNYTATAPVKVWHTLAYAFVLGAIVGAIVGAVVF